MTAQETIPTLPGYEVCGRIGGGGMGEVFEAVDRSLGRRVAIKRLRGDRLDPALPGWGAWNARFRREARLLAAINHPNIATIHAIVEHESVLHLVMEHVDGHALRDVLRSGPLDLDLALEIARQIATGLLAAHEAGVIHRDIKPDNIRINSKSVLKILDFGLAREHAADLATDDATAPRLAMSDAAHTQVGAFLGTPGYASPEQVLGEPVDQRADVFGFGCVLFEMLCGQRPFDGRGRAGAQAVLEQEPPWLLLPSDLPSRLIELIRACLARDRLERPPDFAEVLLVLSPPRAPGSPAHKPAREAAVPNNLPREHTSFIGRSAEAREVLGLIRAGRLVTLTGLGGTGKSRLANHVARVLSRPRPDGIRDGQQVGAAYFVGVEPRQTAARLMHALARAMDGHHAPVRPRAEMLAQRLSRESALVLVDGCEHSLETCRDFVVGLLEADEGVRVMCTSRERLGIAGEAVYRVPTLPVPAAEESLRRRSPAFAASVDDPLRAPDALRLFLDRASHSLLRGPDGRVPTTDLVAAGSICRRLGGIPLAIEIAAGFVEAISPPELDERLARGVQMLSHPLDADPQERTIESVLRWSIDRLEPREVAVLRRVAVFSGEFTLAAAETVAADRVSDQSVGDGADVPVRARDLLSALLSLVRRGLVVKTESTRPPLGWGGSMPASITRYQLLDPVRQFLVSTAIETGREREIARARSRHAGYYLSLVERLSPQLEGPHQAASMAALSDEHREILAAMDSMSDPGEVLRLAVGMARYWYKAGLAALGRVRLEEAVERAVPGSAEGGSTSEVSIRARAFLGVLNWAEGRLDEAERCYRSAIGMAREIGDHVQAAAASTNLGLLLMQRGDLAGAEGAQQDAMRAGAASGDPSLVDRARLHIGVLRIHMGAWAEARAILEDCLERFRAAGDTTRVARTLAKLGMIHQREGRLEEAWAADVEALGIALNSGDRPAITEVMERCALTAWQRKEPALAVRLLRIATRLRAEDGSHPAGELEQELRKIAAEADESPEKVMDGGSAVDTLSAAQREFMAIRVASGPR